MLSRRIYLLLTLIVVISSSPILSESPPTCDGTITLECQHRLLSEAEKFTATYRQCLLDQLKSSEVKIWKFLSKAIRSCLARERLSEVINMTMIGRRKPRDLSKFVILPSPIDSPCVAVIARGKDSDGKGSAEQELVRLMPHCELHVADLNPNAKVSNGKIYKKVISFQESGDETWNMYADKIGMPREDPSYPRNVVTLKNFLEKHVKKPKIDYLWVDRVLPTMTTLSSGKPHILPATNHEGYMAFRPDLKDVALCQITLTIDIFIYDNGVDASEEARNVLEVITPLFISVIPILPIRSYFSKKTSKFHTTYLNMANPSCLKKFLAPVYCGKESCLADKKLDQLKYIDDEWEQFQENQKKFLK